MDIDNIRQLIKADLRQTDDIIRRSLRSEIDLIAHIIDYMLKAGGKRFRPILAILVARACGYTGDQHALLAAIVELIHTATLLHDDVVDASELRRGKKTVNVVWDNSASILTGDFIYSRSFQLMVELHDLSIIQILADASNKLAEGEMAQLQNCYRPDVSVQNYMAVIEGKTATLFAAAAQIAAILAGQDVSIQNQMYQFGLSLGKAFQITDDIMDYSSHSDTMGKNLGDDLTEGKPTLPLIYAMQMAKKSDAEIIRQAILHGKTEDIDQIIVILNTCGALEKTKEQAVAQSDRAKQQLQGLPDNDYTSALCALCQLAIRRSF